MAEGSGSLSKLFAEAVARGREARLDAGALLWREGDPGDSVAFVLEGTLAVTDRTPQGDMVTLGTLAAGSVVGEMAAYDGRPRSATVRASTPCRLTLLSSEDFRALIDARPDILAELFWLEIERVRSLTSHVTRTHHRSITDPLTGLYNYGFFRERLALEIERAHATGDCIALVMFDIDHFKNYNDVHGHEEGNAILASIADVLRDVARRGDILVRYGGEEFVALLYGATAHEAVRFAESIRRAVEALDFPGAETQPLGRLTLSAGVAVLGGAVDTDEALIRAADRCLYRAKESGRNQVVAAAE